MVRASNGRTTNALVVSAFVISMATTASASVEHIGTFGNVYPILEKDAIAAIKDRLKGMEESGQMDALQKEWQQKALARIENGPNPVQGVKKATKDKVRIFDPSIEVTEPIRDEQGRVIVPAGTRVNPLDYMTLTREYLLIDGTDASQVKWALNYASQRGGDLKARIILVNGSPVKLEREHNVRFFFDQDGRIVRRFGINVVPSILRGRNDRIEIVEVAGL
jgi:conjugal transfer pilus assembly protein TraW